MAQGHSGINLTDPDFPSLGKLHAADCSVFPLTECVCLTGCLFNIRKEEVSERSATFIINSLIHCDEKERWGCLDIILLKVRYELLNTATPHTGLHTSLTGMLLLPSGESIQLNVPSVRHMPNAYTLFKF